MSYVMGKHKKRGDKREIEGKRARQRKRVCLITNHDIQLVKTYCDEEGVYEKAMQQLPKKLKEKSKSPVSYLYFCFFLFSSLFSFLFFSFSFASFSCLSGILMGTFS